MQLYYITDRSAFPGDEANRRQRLLEKIVEAARAGVDYIQLRERDLSPGDLETLAREAAGLIRDAWTESTESTSKLFVNSRTDIALAAGADGVHLRGDDISPQEVAAICANANRPSLLTAVSCHSIEDVERAQQDGAHFAALAPIFGKASSPQTTELGIETLREACRREMPVFALGGVTFDNASACREAGTAGLAGIRLFQNNRVEDVVRRLRAH